ncbi:MAG: HEAT repeat domain-containing protein [Planctomycetaceae bacterium]|nr:HEAT repeat domain-containing protein [Planctomycetaceae bacterium]
MSLTAGALFGILAWFAAPADDEPLQPAIKTFHDDYSKRGAKDEDRILAVRALAQYRHEKIVRVLGPLLTEASLAVRVMTARELGQFAGVEAASKELLAALRSSSNAGKKETPVRIEILRGLGNLRVGEAAGDVAKLVEDRDVWIAKAAIDAAGKIRTPEAMVPLIRSLRRIESRNGDAETSLNPFDELFPEMITGSTLLRPDARQAAKRPSEREVLKAPILGALQLITRQTWESAKEWETWWTKRKGSFRLPE